MNPPRAAPARGPSRRPCVAARSCCGASCAPTACSASSYARLLARFLYLKLRWRGRLRTDGICFVCPGVKLEIGRGATLHLGRWSWLGHGTKIRVHEGEVAHRRQVGHRPGVHRLGLSARLDRPRVHRRRPGDADRFRSRRGGGRAPDPPAGDLQARRARRAQRVARLRCLRPARGDRRRTTASSEPARSSPATCPRTPSWAACPPASSACATRPPHCAGGDRGSLTLTPTGPPVGPRAATTPPPAARAAG